MISRLKALKVFSCVLVILSTYVQAQESSKQQPIWPDQLIQTVTADVLAGVEQNRDIFNETPEPFYAVVTNSVLPIMDMRSFARGVMGRYASSSAYRALQTDEEKELFKQRILTFTEIFQESVVRTYSKGLMAFNGESVSVLPLSEDSKLQADKTGKVTVEQHIARENDDPYVLMYSFAKSKDGSWQVRNLLVDGINLGRVYQSQFAQAVTDNDGDVDAAIKSWAVNLEG